MRKMFSLTCADHFTRPAAQVRRSFSPKGENNDLRKPAQPQLPRYARKSCAS
jgi:hypothetical protein